MTLMLFKGFGSIKNPRRMLLVGLIGALAVVSINTAAQYQDYQTIVAEKHDFRRRSLAYDRCAADVEKSGKFGGLLDVGIEAMCPVKPSRGGIDFHTKKVRGSQATALWLAGIVIALSSLPWLASRRTRARVGPARRA